ncbi:hypothetical protein MVEN_02528400 [Mycena venus]|uniref:Uncharacterized protein n=1 Tax=Mycena venus TaxID=2733690 RepID=A0A8H6WUS1_9AGAR|nr:hypothetical protein MVEN_02528400 [Mycena venus]
MEKIASVIAALDAGKLPSTEQLNSFNDWLTHSAFPPVDREPSGNTLSDQGRVLANDVHEVLVAYNLLNTHKNHDNLLQEAIWHLTEGDVNTVVESSGDVVDKEQVSADIKAVRSSIRTILSIVWQNFSDGGFLPTDVTSFFLLTLSDAAEVVQDQAGRTKDSLRNVEQDIQEGERDSLGRDKKRLDEEQDKRVAFEHTMDTLKDVGSGVIGAGQSAKEKTEDLSERASGLLWDTYYTACERARNDPQYHSALSTLFDTLHKWVSKAFDAAASDDQPFTLDSFIEDPSPDQHIHKGLDAFKILLDRFANPESSVDDVLDKLQRFVSVVRGNSDEFKAWVDKFFEHAHRSLDDPEYPSSDQAQEVRRQLRTRRRELLDSDTDAGRTWAALQESAQTFGAAVAADVDVQRVHAAHTQLGNDAKNAFVEAGAKTALEGVTWFWRDLFAVYAQRVLAMLKDIPIPRTEYVDNDIELVLENLDVSSFAINPAHITISNTTDVDVRTSETTETTTSVGTFTHIRLQAVQLTLKDVSFYYKDKDKKAAPQPSEFTGILAMTLPPQGLDVDMKLRLIPSTKERKAKQGYYRVEQLDVQITDEIKLKVRESNHAVMLSLFKPIFNKRIREALSRSLAEQFRTVLDGLDAVAWDVGRRAEVFVDTGLGRGASLTMAAWSEIGRLIRERKFGVRATGTGVVVEGAAQDAPKFAMGAEPQILPGEKRGPMGTGSESLENRGAQAAQGVKEQIGSVDTTDAKNQVRGAAGEGKRQVQSFQQSVEEKKTMERRNPGWKSAAYDL